ncbi:MAG: low molecular weight phosphatase family protein [Candidatus Bathyarchaeum sp.]|nr:MAG: low molecular weight phosphatase family protein [Candidatus Bathyarchaeum sp.]
MKKRILFLCTQNSARSQMAEGLLNAFYGDNYEGYSAGVTPTKVNPYAVKSMAEIGVDISRNRSKSIEEFRGENFNYVVTVCDNARETCPFFPGEEIIHKSFEDPAQFKGSEEEILKQVRRVRNEINEWIKNRFT